MPQKLISKLQSIITRCSRTVKAKDLFNLLLEIIVDTQPACVKVRIDENILAVRKNLMEELVCHYAKVTYTLFFSMVFILSH